MSPVKGSDLAKQIELARQEIERWPQWLKEASGIAGREAVECCRENAPTSKGPLSNSDFLD